MIALLISVILASLMLAVLSPISVGASRSPVDPNITFAQPDAVGSPTHTLFLPLVLFNYSSDEISPEIRFDSADYSVAAGEGRAEIPVLLSAPATQPVTVAYVTQDGTAAAGVDYVAVSDTLRFAPSQTQQTVVVPLYASGNVAPDKYFTLALTDPRAARLGSPHIVTVTIRNDNVPAFRFTSAHYAVNEGAGSVPIDVALAPASWQTVTVAYATSDGAGRDLPGAVAPGDYTSVSGTLTFAPGATQGSFAVPVIDNRLVDGDKALTLTVSDPTNAELGTPATATLMIEDDDSLPRVRFASDSYTVSESAGEATLQVQLSAAYPATVTVEYAGNGGTIILPGGDVAGRVTFLPGQTMQTFTLPVVDDQLVGPDKTVPLQLLDPDNAVLGAPHTAIVTVEDDDVLPQVRFASDSYHVSESAGEATIQAQLSRAYPVTVSVDYATRDETAIAPEDYEAVSGTLRFAPGQTQGSFAIPVIDNELLDGDRSLTLALSDPTNAERGAPVTATLTIEDNDDLPTVRFASSHYSVGEAAGAATIQAQLSRAYPLTVSVAYSTADGTALAPDDYTPVSGTLTFAPDETQHSIAVPVHEISDGDKTLTVTLRQPSNATLGAPVTATITIRDGASGAVWFSSPAYAVSEGGLTATLPVVLGSPLSTTVTVTYATRDGAPGDLPPAVAGGDYIPVSGTLRFEPEEVFRVISIPVIDNDRVDGDRILTVVLSDPVNAELIDPYTATVTIEDDDALPGVRFSSAGYEVGEAAGAATLQAQLSRAYPLTVTVDYATHDGTARAPDDYTPVSGTLTFAPGETQGEIIVPVIDNDLVDGDRTLTLTLVDPENAVLGTPATATVTIEDDDALPSIRLGGAGYEVGEAAGAATLLAQLNRAYPLTVTVDYATHDGTARAPDDYTSVSGTLAFAPGQTSRSIAIPVIDDGLVEPDETLTLILVDPENAVLGTPATATVTIEDDDALPVVRFASSSYSVGEGVGQATLQAQLSRAYALTVTVDYATADGAPDSPGVAHAPDDYTSVSGTLRFAPGETQGSFTVPVIDDGLVEPTETLTVTLSHPSAAALGAPATATLMIEDNDVFPTVQFAAGAYSVSEGAGEAILDVTLGQAYPLTVSVAYSTADGAPDSPGAATAPDDYTAVSGGLHFAPGEISRQFVIPINDNLIDGLDKTLTAILSSPANAQLGAPTTATLTILDDEVLTAQFSAADYSVDEAAGAALITVTLNVASELTGTVAYSSADGVGGDLPPAQAGMDYTAVSGVLTFAPGTRAQTFTVPIFDDPIVEEEDETVYVTLSARERAQVGEPGVATLTIVDQDVAAPFSLQIAALHQVTPQAQQMIQLADGAKVPQMGVQALDAARTEAEWIDLYTTTYVTLTQALEESGAVWSRVRIEWEMIEPLTPTEGQPPNYVWGPYHDVKLRLVAETGVRMIGTIVDPPDWAADVPCGPLYPDRMDDYARFLTDLVNRYNKPPYYIKHWEIANEPDYTKSDGHEGGLGCWGYDGDKYAELLALAYTTIKATDPEATVLMGGIAHDWFTEVGGVFYRYFPDIVMDNGGGAYTDAFNFHYFPDFHAEWERWDNRSKDQRYGWLPDPTCGNVYNNRGASYSASGIDFIAKTTFLRNRMATCHNLNKPIWVTELAEHGYPGDDASLARQARYVIKGHARGLSAGVENITWYSLDRAPYDPYYQSLLYDDFSTKPAYDAYQTLTGELIDYDYRHHRSAWVYDDSDRGYRYVIEAYIFEDEAGNEKTVVWGETDQTLDFQADQVRTVDRWGDATIITDGGAGDADGAQNGTVVLQLSNEPLFVTAE